MHHKKFKKHNTKQTEHTKTIPQTHTTRTTKHAKLQNIPKKQKTRRSITGLPKPMRNDNKTIPTIPRTKHGKTITT